MTTVTWPNVLKPTSFGYKYLDADISGGRSVSGGEQFIASPGPRWSAEMTLPIFRDDQVLAARALRTQLRGRSNPVALPNFDGRRLSWPVEAKTGRVLTPSTASELEGTRGLTGTDYAGWEIPTASEIVATVRTAALAGATYLKMTLTQGGPVLPGQQFGLGQRLYEIEAESELDGVEVRFLPPLREDAPVGTAVLFTRPTCLMRVMNLNDELGALEMMRYATLNLQFVEYL
jgi:hypothetical protein